MAALRAAVVEHGVAERITVTGEPQRSVVGFTGPSPLVTKSWIQQAMQDAGFLFNGSMFICARHSAEDLSAAAAAFASACAVVAAAGDDLADHLRGRPVEPVFRGP